MSIEDLKRARKLYVKDKKGESISYSETYIMQFMNHTINLIEDINKKLKEKGKYEK